MKANEFVKKHGLNKALDVVNRDDCIYAIAVCVYEGRLSYSVSMAYGFTLISDLKCLVESWKLVNFYGGIQNAKEIVKISVRSGYGPSSLSDINQAIADVESCQ